MMNRTAAHYLRLGAWVIGLSASLAHAGTIAIEPTAGDPVVAMLDDESRLFADAYRRLIVAKGLGEGGNSGAWARVRQNMHSSTVARVEYTYAKEGRTLTRVYHARSGPAMEVVLSRIDLSVPGTGSSGGSSGTESGGSRPYEITEDDIAKDFAERVYYPADTALDVRVPNLSGDGSDIRAVLVEGVRHEADAELKIFRQIEKDVTDKAVATGGRLVGYVSKAVCTSCSAASKELADNFNIDGTIYQLVEPETSAPPARDPLLRESNEASSKLKALRKRYAQENFKRKAVTSPEHPAWLEPEVLEGINVEEARTAESAVCAE
jgi:hypothetical protein